MNYWTEEEMLLTLYIYLTRRSDELNKTSEFLMDFCEKLNAYTGKDRTSASIAMRVSNFRAVDPKYKKVGLNNGGKNVKYIWDNYSSKLDYLEKIYVKFVNETANIFREAAKKEIGDISVDLDELDDKISFKNINVEAKDAYVEALINVRNCAIQKVFKDNLSIEFNHKCALCDVDIKDFLVASHILPYSKCKKKEDMINHNNGLLLCPMHDSLFDKMFISFDSDGHILLSDKIAKEKYGDYKLRSDMFLDKKYLNKERLKFLRKHEELFFKKQNRK